MTDPHRPSGQHDPLHDLFDTAAPAGPDLDPAARARSVAVRGRGAVRRTRLALGAAVAVAAVVAVAVPLSLWGEDPEPAPVAADPPAAAIPEPQPCPDPPVQVEDLQPVDDLPDDAAWARVCLGAVASEDSIISGEIGFDSVPVTGTAAADLVAEIEVLPAYRSEDRCMAIMIAPEPWTLVVAGPGGEPATIGATTTLCSSVSVGGVERSSERVLALVEQALAAQEPAGSGAPAAAACPPQPTDVAGLGPVDLPETAVAVRACRALLQDNGPARAPDAGPGALPVGPLTGEAAEQFVAAVRDLPPPDRSRCSAARPAALPWLLTITAADGSSVVLGAPFQRCVDVTVDGRDVAVEDVVAAYRAAAR